MSIRTVARELYHAGYRLVADDELQLAVGDVTAEIDNATPIVRNRIRGLADTNHEILERLLDVTGSSDTFWDLGAHVGRYTCTVGQTVDRVVAVEAHPRNVAVLGRNVARNGVDATIVQAAIADESGTAEFSVTHDAAGEFLRGAEVRESPDDGDIRPVPTLRGAAIVPAYDVPAPTVLRIDVTGVEPEAIDGMGDLLESVRYAVVHTYPDRYDDPDAVHRRLTDHGFAVEDIADRVVWAARDPS